MNQKAKRLLRPGAYEKGTKTMTSQEHASAIDRADHQRAEAKDAELLAQWAKDIAACTEHYCDNQGLCHRCGALVDPHLWAIYTGEIKQ